MIKPVKLLMTAIVCLAPLLSAGAEVDLFDMQAALLLGETTVKVPAEAQEADLAAIRDCIKGAKGITLDLSATKITELGGVFKNCTALKAVILPSTLTSIGAWAFSGCDSLTSITIPTSVTSIGERAFSGCDKLAKIDVAKGSKNYASVDGVLFSKDKTTLVCFPAGKSGEYYEVPGGTVTIGDSAFYECTGLKVVKLPSGVKSIGDSAFSHCENLSLIKIPESVTSTGSSAFSGCTSLTSVTFAHTGEAVREVSRNWKLLPYIALIR